MDLVLKGHPIDVATMLDVHVMQVRAKGTTTTVAMVTVTIWTIGALVGIARQPEL